jgi:hypothetical protein
MRNGFDFNIDRIHKLSQMKRLLDSSSQEDVALIRQLEREFEAGGGRQTLSKKNLAKVYGRAQAHSSQTYKPSTTAQPIKQNYMKSFTDESMGPAAAEADF